MRTFRRFDYACFAARFAAHILFVAAMIAARPAALSFRFSLGACAGADAVFFVAADFAFAALAALAFFRFAASVAFAAADSFRLGLGAGACAGGSASPLILAHRSRWASLIRFMAAALNLRLVGFAGAWSASVSEVPVSIARSSAICASIRCFCASKPTMAASMIVFVSLPVGISMVPVPLNHLVTVKALRTMI
jgi:hypothetical protein